MPLKSRKWACFVSHSYKNSTGVLGHSLPGYFTNSLDALLAMREDDLRTMDDVLIWWVHVLRALAAESIR